MLVTHKAKMSQDGPEYSVEIPVAGLAAGTHFLHTVIAIYEPAKLLGTHKGAVVRVPGPESHSTRTTPAEVALTG